MEIHKPKPVRNWREFAKEIGIIVLSILIALGLEQVVEYAHWKREVEAGRQAIQAEITNHMRWYSYRIGIAPCIDRKADEAQAILDAMESRGTPKPFTVFQSRGAGTPLSESEWESERASQALTHFPRRELALMSQYYTNIPQLRGWMDEEAIVWSRLSGLKYLPSGLTASDILRLRGDLDRARNIQNLILNNATGNILITDRLGIPRVTPYPGRVEAFCAGKAMRSNLLDIVK